MASSATVRQCDIGASIKRPATRRVDGTARVPSAVRRSRRVFSVMQIVLGAAITHPGATAVSRS